ncbi:DUF1565 domain-containing protein [Rhodopseudomonas sp. B29]|uniref:DUF1565 domain-containing protein n=1 Tax=Rhodopseudomonas sp. B29 TaxID=95607 RepID=UPI0011D2697C|nr:DUF1565 domain-containing protein [Rhodopseudomonas sp. B29]
MTAAFFNGLLANMRSVWRGNGSQLDGITPVIADTGSPDTGMLRAIQHLMQRGLTNYAADIGAQNAVVVTVAPAPVELRAGLQLRVKLAYDITGPSTITVNGFPVKSLTRADGSPTVNGDAFKGQIAVVEFDGTAFQIVGTGGRVLSAPRTYYVSAVSGNDANPGSLTAPFRTIQRGVNEVGRLQLNGYTGTVLVADGTYPESVNLPSVSQNGAAVLIGNETSFSNCFINSPAGSAIIAASPGANWTVGGFKLIGRAAPGDAGNALWVPASGRSIGYRNIEFGYCPGVHINSTGGEVVKLGPIAISGSSGAHVFANGGSMGSGVAYGVTLIGSINFTSGFVVAINGGRTSYIYTLVSGAATGPRYLAAMNGVISVLGAGESYYPGDTAGSKNTGGQYA